MMHALDQRKDEPPGFQLSTEDAAVLLSERSLVIAGKSNRRILVGIAGGPGSGKSTLASAVIGTLNEIVDGAAARLPMDGFLMPKSRLEALGLTPMRGAPETFEATAFITLLKRLKAARQPVTVPYFSKRNDDVVPHAFDIAGNVPIVVVEGAYLLLPTPPWDEIRTLLDIVVHIDVPREIVRKRLVKRHTGPAVRSEDLTAQVDDLDLRNFDLVAPAAARADMILDIIDDPNRH